MPNRSPMKGVGLAVPAIRFGTAVENAPNLAPPTSYVAIRVQRIPAAVRWSFLLFVFSFLFEAIDISSLAGSVTVVRVAGVLFFACYCLNSAFGPRQKSFFPSIPAPMYWFLGYVTVYLLNFLFLFTAQEELDVLPFWQHYFTLVQFLILFWLASDLLRERTMARSVLMAFLVAATIVALGNLLQVPGFYEVGAQGRVTALADNLGAVAERMGFAAVIAIGLYVCSSHKHVWDKFLLLGSMLIFLVVMVKTGGRGQTAAFMVGAWVYLLPLARSKRAIGGIIVGLVCIVGLVYVSATNPYVSERWHQSFEGDLAGRQILYPTAIDMILERPIFGWQPTVWDYELGHRIGLWVGKDAHNLVLSILLEVGIVGACPFFIGLWLCGRSAWRARRGNLGVLPLALLVTALASSMSVTTFISSGSKMQWLILAMTVAAAASGPVKLGEQSFVRLVNRPVKRTRSFFSTTEASRRS